MAGDPGDKTFWTDDLSSGFQGPASGQHLRLVQHGERRLLLLVWRVAVPAQDPTDQHAELGADVLPQRPVDGDVAPHGVDHLAGDVPEGLVAQDLDRAVVRLERVVEGQLVIGEPERLPAGVGCSCPR